MRKLRASKAPIAMHCLQSLRTIDHPAVSHETEATTLGTFVHNQLAEWMETKEVKEAEWERLAGLWGLKPDEAVTLIMTGIAMWGDEEGGLCLDHGETLWFEENMSSQFNHNGMEILLTGTADIASHRDRDGESQIVIDDWKTGQVSPASFHQLFQYAILALRKWQDADSIKVRLNWLREGWSDELEFTAAEIMKKQTEVLDWLSQDLGSAEYRTGDHCKYCPLKYTCNGWNQVTSSLVKVTHAAELQNNILGSVRSLHEKGQLGQAHTLAKQLESLMKSFFVNERLVIEEKGPVPIGEGKELALIEMTKTEIEPGAGIHAAYEELGGDVYQCCKISKTKLEELLKAKAPPRQKAKKVREFMDHLDQAGALTKTTSTQLRVRKARD